MTTVTVRGRTEPFDDALKRARIRVLCGGSDKEYRELFALKRIERVLNQSYCIGGGGTIRVDKRRV